MAYHGFKRYTDYTREQVRHLLSTDQKWAERAIVILYRNRQTTTEQNVQQTVENNERGFQQMDARFFSSLAEWIENRGKQGVPLGRRLTPKQYACAMKPWGRNRIPRVAKYARQILEEIEAKAKAAAGE
jgi:hypothetical protein